MANLEKLEHIKDGIKEKFNLSRCSLSEKENLQLVLYDNLLDNKMEEIAEYCKKELEKLNKTQYEFTRCKSIKSESIGQHISSDTFTCLFFFREQTS